jgi:hypothetical protein
MDASTLKQAADTVTEKLGPVTETVTEKLAPVTETVVEKLGDLGDTALRVAALTPWVEARASRRGFRSWLVGLAAVAALAAIAYWLVNRTKGSTEVSRHEEDAALAADETGRRLAAAAGD